MNGLRADSVLAFKSFTQEGNEGNAIDVSMLI